MPLSGFDFFGAVEKDHRAVRAVVVVIIFAHIESCGT